MVSSRWMKLIWHLAMIAENEWFVRSSENNIVNLLAADSSETPIRRLILKRSEMNPLWNMVKVVRRGRGEIAEFVSVKQYALGMRILVQ